VGPLAPPAVSVDDGDAMIRWPALVRNVLASGTASALVSSAVLALAGRRETGSPFAPINAVSHWFFGDRATRRDGATAKYTLTGLVTHFGAALFWSSFYEALCAFRRNPTPASRLADAALVSAVACFVDYRLTPPRLTPGYEHRLSRGALALVYLSFAVGLAAGAQVVQSRRSTASALPHKREVR
jgi:hypothetical protein